MEDLIKTVFSALGAALAAAITALVVQLLRKVNIELSAENRAKLETITQQGILLMEEKAASAARAHVAVPAREKLEGAIGYVLERVPGVTREEAADLVLSELPKLGLGATDFARAVAAKAAAPTAAVIVPAPSMPEGEK